MFCVRKTAKILSYKYTIFLILTFIFSEIKSIFLISIILFSTILFLLLIIDKLSNYNLFTPISQMPFNNSLQFFLIFLFSSSNNNILTFLFIDSAKPPYNVWRTFCSSLFSSYHQTSLKYLCINFFS